MNQNWKQNPHLKNMDESKLEFLNTYAEKLSKTPKDQLMTAFLSMQNDAKQKKIQFKPQETELLMQILSSNMSPEEKKRMETLTALAKKLAVRN